MPIHGWTASPPAKPSRGGGVSEQDRAHRLGGDAPAGELPAHGQGDLGCQAKLWSLRERANIGARQTGHAVTGCTLRDDRLNVTPTPKPSRKGPCNGANS
jgi:hypothetical protein